MRSMLRRIRNTDIPRITQTKNRCKNTTAGTPFRRKCPNAERTKISRTKNELKTPKNHCRLEKAQGKRPNRNTNSRTAQKPQLRKNIGEPIEDE